MPLTIMWVPTYHYNVFIKRTFVSSKQKPYCNLNFSLVSNKKNFYIFLFLFFPLEMILNFLELYFTLKNWESFLITLFYYLPTN